MRPTRLTTINYTSSASPGVARYGGFTLVEVLISLVLSAIIFVSAYQVISNLIQYQVRYAEKSDRQMDRLLVKNMVNQILEKGLHQSSLYYRFQKSGFFKGETDSIQIISRAYSDHFDVPGYRVYRLYATQDELYVDYRRYDKDSIASNPVRQTSGIKVEKIAFEYFINGRWGDEWSDEDKIPSLIKVRVTFPDNGSFEWISQTGRA